MHRRVGREPSTGVARDATVCLQQARLFYETARESGLEIRPLQLFYGSLATARALTIIQRNVGLSGLPQAHGVKDVSADNARLMDLRVRIERSGTFPDYNNAVALENSVHLTDSSATTTILSLPSAHSKVLAGKTITLKDVLARIANLRDLYELTFQEASLAAWHGLGQRFDGVRQGWELNVMSYGTITTITDVTRVVERCRQRFPVLSRWRVVWVQNSVLGILVRFRDEQDPGIPIEEQLRPNAENCFYPAIPPGPAVPLPDLFENGSASNAGLIAPLQDRYICPPSLAYLGICLLSSLVRYRPDTWLHAISRRASQERPADDQSLALIERFLHLVQGTIQQSFLDFLYPNERA